VECAVNVRTLAWIETALSTSEGLLARARLAGRAEGAWRGAAIDSRGDCAGRLFFALSGGRTDGHRFVRDAYAAGAAAAVIDQAPLSEALAREGVAHFVVSDARAALTALASAWREHLDVRVVAITGSGGKTTTKELIRAAMRTRYRVHTSAGNYNSTIGVPLTLLDAEEDSEYLVCELGANQTGEIAQLSALVKPDTGVITNIGDAHVGCFGSRDAIAAAKGELLDALPAEASAVLPRDDTYFPALHARARARVTSFGLAAESDVRLSDVRVLEHGTEFRVAGVAFTLRSFGVYNALNACAAAAAADACGVPIEATRDALAELSPMAGRGRVHEAGGVLVVDESYNASPASTRLSLSMLAGLKAERRYAVLGDMRELGDYTRAGHEEVGRHVASLRIDKVFWKGEEAGAVAAGLAAAGGGAALERFEDAAALLSAVLSIIRPGDAVLVKGSRAIELDRLVEGIVAARASD